MDNLKCSSHQAKNATNYCCIEKVLICADCLKNHNGHLLYTLKEVEDLKLQGVDLLKPKTKPTSAPTIFVRIGTSTKARELEYIALTSLAKATINGMLMIRLGTQRRRWIVVKGTGTPWLLLLLISPHLINPARRSKYYRTASNLYWLLSLVWHLTIGSLFRKKPAKSWETRWPRR